MRFSIVVLNFRRPWIPRRGNEVWAWTGRLVKGGISTRQAGDRVSKLPSIISHSRCLRVRVTSFSGSSPQPWLRLSGGGQHPVDDRNAIPACLSAVLQSVASALGLAFRSCSHAPSFVPGRQSAYHGCPRRRSSKYETLASDYPTVETDFSCHSDIPKAFWKVSHLPNTSSGVHLEIRFVITFRPRHPDGM